MLAAGLAAPVASARVASSGQISGRQFLRQHGYLVSNPAVYARIKAGAARWAGQPVSQATSPNDPVASPSFEGVFNGTFTPPDTTGAVGPKNYIEAINGTFGLYKRSGALVASAAWNTLFGGGFFSYSDPQVLWDPHTQRFYLLIWDTTNATMKWALSKTDSPTTLTSASWCVYTSTFGYNPNDAPDYPKLGQTKDFLLIGVNFFLNFQTFQGGDLLTIQKPQGSAPITNCPGNTFNTHRFAGLKNADGSLTNAPEPAQQADPSGKGYVITTADTGSVPSADYITVFQVKKSPSGDPKLSGPKTLTVPRFSAPASAIECSPGKPLDTLDGRFEHAVSAVNPSAGTTPVIWTAHAVLGGKGSQERWYEIQYGSPPTLVQSGKATSSSLYVWNGSIASDRTVNPTGTAHGKNMVMGFSTSSATECPAIQMVSKVGANPQSGFVLVKQSTVPYFASFDPCDRGPGGMGCRWGDYSGASPDPAAPLADPKGKVWLANQWLNTSNNPNWRTWIWGATP